MGRFAAIVLVPVPRALGHGRIQQQMYISIPRPATGAELVALPFARRLRVFPQVLFSAISFGHCVFSLFASILLSPLRPPRG